MDLTKCLDRRNGAVRFTAISLSQVSTVFSSIVRRSVKAEKYGWRPEYSLSTHAHSYFETFSQCISLIGHHCEDSQWINLCGKFLPSENLKFIFSRRFGTRVCMRKTMGLIKTIDIELYVFFFQIRYKNIREPRDLLMYTIPYTYHCYHFISGYLLF